mmetsp:Transcript_19458/g.68907  ORF Transcript_19458/g.68907 Transcript_19458/m.68907 type:complete len:229 (-) Transcript_19458:1836-2522(-)
MRSRATSSSSFSSSSAGPPAPPAPTRFGVGGTALRSFALNAAMNSAHAISPSLSVSMTSAMDLASAGENSRPSPLRPSWNSAYDSVPLPSVSRFLNTSLALAPERNSAAPTLPTLAFISGDSGTSVTVPPDMRCSTTSKRLANSAKLMCESLSVSMWPMRLYSCCSVRPRSSFFSAVTNSLYSTVPSSFTSNSLYASSRSAHTTTSFSYTFSTTASRYCSSVAGISIL